MKFTLIAAVLALTVSLAFADHHEEGKKKTDGHDKEHMHVTKDVDHAHTDEHHKDHDHKAHHPEHAETKSTKTTTTTTTKKQ